MSTTPPSPATPGPWDTHSVLLEKLARFDEVSAWGLVDTTFRAPLLALARRAGLDATDAQDAVQETLLVFARGLRDGTYRRGEGKLSGWLFGIARRQFANAQRKRAQATRPEVELEQEAEADGELEERWEEEWERHLLRRCLERLRLEVEPKTFDLFVAVTLLGLAAPEVAERHGVTLTVVYNTKSRLARRLARLREELEDEA